MKNSRAFLKSLIKKYKTHDFSIKINNGTWNAHFYKCSKCGICWADFFVNYGETNTASPRLIWWMSAEKLEEHDILSCDEAKVKDVLE